MKKVSKLNIILAVSIVVLLAIVIFRSKDNDIVPVKNIDQNINTEPKNPPSSLNSILGRKEDLISFSIKPFTEVHGILSYRGSIKGGYFFEANILVNVLDANKKLLKAGNGVAKSEWMTAGLVEFEGNIDFTNLAKGPGYIQIHNDNESGLTENDKEILIPIVIK